jgi:vacuolar-type H+-ATPase subunit H
MAQQKKRLRHELESLIPTIKNEENRLEDMLGDARVRADGIIRDAETGAAERIRTTRDELPGVIQAERDARHAALVTRASEAAGGERERNRALEASARAAMEMAVDYIVSLVWPSAPGTAPGALSPRPPGPAAARAPRPAP